MKLVRNDNKKLLIIIGRTKHFPCGQYQIGYIASKKAFKVRDIVKLVKNGGEWSQDTKYYSTLKEAINSVK
jgi:hypothetical protein